MGIYARAKEQKIIRDTEAKQDNVFSASADATRQEIKAAKAAIAAKEHYNAESPEDVAALTATFVEVTAKAKELLEAESVEVRGTIKLQLESILAETDWETNFDAEV